MLTTPVIAALFGAVYFSVSVLGLLPATTCRGVMTIEPASLRGAAPAGRTVMGFSARSRPTAPAVAARSGRPTRALTALPRRSRADTRNLLSVGCEDSTRCGDHTTTI